MSNQEMQFADPDWEPTQSGQKPAGAQQSSVYTPQPVNEDRRERFQQPAVETPSAQEEIYAGAIPEQPRQAPYQYQQMPYRRPRRRRRAWLWIVIAILFFSLMSGGASALGSIGQRSVTQNISTSNLAAGTPTIVINETDGNIQVHRGSSLAIEEVKNSGFFDDPNNINVKVNQSGSTITVNVDTGTSPFSSRSVDFNITVPLQANLQLTTTSGDISVNDNEGAMTLSTVSGNISAINDTFTGNASLSSTSGDIHSAGDTFGSNVSVTTVSGDVEMNQDNLEQSAKVNTTSGNIDYNGIFASSNAFSPSYQFHSDGGDIRIGLPSAENLSVQADTTSGSINADDAPSITVRDTKQGPGSQASGIVGTSSGPLINISTNSGDITLQQNQ